MKKLIKLLKDENGQGLVEYSIIIALIAVVCIVTVTLIGPKVRAMIGNQTLNDSLKAKNQGGCD